MKYLYLAAVVILLVGCSKEEELPSPVIQAELEVDSLLLKYGGIWQLNYTERAYGTHPV